MSALADALAAAQSRAVAALGKQYVGGQLHEDEVRVLLDGIGLNDPTDRDHWIAALNIIRDTGATLPNGDAPAQRKEPATAAQRERIKRDVEKLHGDAAATTLASEPTLTKAQASEIISSIVAGSFDLERWAVPF